MARTRRTPVQRAKAFAMRHQRQHKALTPSELAMEGFMAGDAAGYRRGVGKRKGASLTLLHVLDNQRVLKAKVAELRARLEAMGYQALQGAKL